MKNKSFVFLITSVAALLAAVCLYAIPVHSSDRSIARAQIAPTIQFYESPIEDKLFLKELRRVLANGEALPKKSHLLDLFQNTTFPQTPWAFALVLYQEGEKRILMVRSRLEGFKNIRTIINRVFEHPRHKDFDFTDSGKNRIQMDFIVNAPESFDIKNFKMEKIDPNRFEIGVDGLRMAHGRKIRYFLPGDAYVKSVMYREQFEWAVGRYYPDTDVNEIEFKKIQSESYVSYGNTWLKLYRGHPQIHDITKELVEKTTDQSIQWVKDFQKEDGRFTYYYDSARDSFLDHDHPKRDLEKNPYYNILRHAGGGLLCLFYYKYTEDISVLEPLKKAVEYLKNQLVEYDLPDGKKAAYIYYNRKAKLGGSGLALYLFSEYQHLTQDKSYEDSSRLLNQHVLSQITDSGEFKYYHIFLDQLVEGNENNQYFSFYYPGEALIGLATYYKYISNDPEEKAHLVKKISKALHFLFVERPKTRKEHYKSLPSDSWLMMAIKELWDIPELRNDFYKNEVLKDADKMVHQTYKKSDALYPDYVGSFYYNYGDYAYADGARAEGLLGAYELAIKVDDKARIKKYEKAIRNLIWATYHLVNTPESVYAFPRPDRAIGGIRFKHTRQWFRIDTIQHVTAFYLKFLPYWTE